jgi:hypothetical protein
MVCEILVNVEEAAGKGGYDDPTPRLLMFANLWGNEKRPHPIVPICKHDMTSESAL